MIPEQFHFQEPLWFLALIPLLCVFCLAFKAVSNAKSWEKVIDPNLLPLLLQGDDKSRGRLAKYILAVGWFIAVVALADPVWEKVPRPIFQTNSARVLVLDLSNSMLIDDLKPNRLARARFKIEDILSRKEEGQTGLVLFAGDAFTASPLTRDTETIRSLLKVLAPQIMPSQGSRVDLGLEKAHELLSQAGVTNGQVLLIADGVSQPSKAIDATKSLRQDGHQVSVLAVGTEKGGELRFNNNKTVSVTLDEGSLREVAKAGNGSFSLITSNNSDLKSVLSSTVDNNGLEANPKGQNNINKEEDDNLQNSDWKSTGPFIVLLLIPFAALAFRRGWLLNVAIVFFVFGAAVQSNEAFAEETNWKELFQNLTKNKAQRAEQALLAKQYEKAKELSDDPEYQGSADYKLGNFESALTSFQKAEGEVARYNEGNALAQQKKYEEAIAAYDEALKLNPKMSDALANKKLIEDFLKQQEEQKSDENQQSSEDGQEGQEGSENSEQSKKNADSKSEDGNEGEQSKEAQQNQEKSDENQFSEANKNADENKSEAEKEEIEKAKQAEENKDKEQTAKGEETEEEKKTKEEHMKKEAEQQQIAQEELEKLKQASKEEAEALSKEEKMAAEQWLRRIPDDPGGLLRRKFRRQYNQLRRNTNSNEQPW